jgi:hypothetical protein
MRATLSLGAALCLLLATAAHADVIFFDDFSAGLRPQFWTIEKLSNEYVVNDTGGNVKFSSPGNGSGYRAVRAHFTPDVIGDFRMSVDISDVQLTRRTGNPSANHVALHAMFGGQHWATTIEDHSQFGRNYHVYLNPPSANFGDVLTTATGGTLVVQRTGNTYTGFFDSNKIFERTFGGNTTPNDLWFSLENNFTNDAISVTFDNFRIEADDILGIPAPAVPLPAAALLGLIGAGATAAARRRFMGRRSTI